MTHRLALPLAAYYAGHDPLAPFKGVPATPETTAGRNQAVLDALHLREVRQIANSLLDADDVERVYDELAPVEGDYDDAADLTQAQSSYSAAFLDALNLLLCPEVEWDKMGLIAWRAAQSEGRTPMGLAAVRRFDARFDGAVGQARIH